MCADQRINYKRPSTHSATLPGVAPDLLTVCDVSRYSVTDDDTRSSQRPPQTAVRASRSTDEIDGRRDMAASMASIERI